MSEERISVVQDAARQNAGASHLEAALRAFLGTDAVAADSVGNYAVQIGANQVLVRILPLEPPIVRVFLPIIRRIAPTPEVLTALNELSRALTFCRMVWINGEVIVATEIRAAGITPDDISWGCLVVEGWAERLQAQLATRFGAEPPLGQRRTLVN